MRQLIIARKDLNMSAGKLAAQVSHASMAFLTNMIRKNICDIPGVDTERRMFAYVEFDKQTWNEWIMGPFTKTVCQAKNRHQLERAIEFANNLGLKEGEDFFLIKDNCLTELEPEEVDENGQGKTLTCIGFRPLPDETAHEISRHYQLYR